MCYTVESSCRLWVGREAPETGVTCEQHAIARVVRLATTLTTNFHEGVCLVPARVFTPIELTLAKWRHDVKLIQRPKRPQTSSSV
eukprot:8132849-Pyramimonas_sp.AAC.1